MSIYDMTEKFVYMTSENYKIMVCSVKKKYFIKFNGIDDLSKPYDTAALAINDAENE